MQEEEESPESTIPMYEAAISSADNKILLLRKDQEIDNLKLEVKDSNEKIETLKIKRNEDRLKLKEYEKTKIQLQQVWRKVS